eukprot:gene7272-22587_t
MATRRAVPLIRQLYDAPGPNPWVVRLAFALKGVDTAPFVRKLTAVDGVPENRGDPALAVLNPQKSTPFMVLEDGSVLAESVSMVQYIDALYPGGGSTGLPCFTGHSSADNVVEAARLSMWQRRVELNLISPFQRQYQNGEGARYFSKHMPWIEASKPAVDGLRLQVEAQLQWLEDQLVESDSTGNYYIAGPDSGITVADLQLYTTAAFMGNPKVNSARATAPFDPFGVGAAAAAAGRDGGASANGEGSIIETLPKLNSWFQNMAIVVGALGKAGR